VVEARGQFRNQEEEEHSRLEVWKPLASNGSADVTVDNGERERESACIKRRIAKCSRAKYANERPITPPPRLQSHHTLGNINDIRAVSWALRPPPPGTRLNRQRAVVSVALWPDCCRFFPLSILDCNRSEPWSSIYGTSAIQDSLHNQYYSTVQHLFQLAAAFSEL
jgi:hypothetical protein